MTDETFGPDQPLTLNLDIEAILKAYQFAIQRTALMVAIGTQPVADIPLTAAMAPLAHLELLKGPLSDEDRIKAEGMYHQWVVGKAFTDLDAQLHHYLDECWMVLQYGQHGRVIPAGFEPSSVATQTKSAEKMLKILEAANAPVDDVEFYRTLSNARNILVHRNGIVTADKAFHDSQAMVAWMAPRAYFVSPDGTERMFEMLEPQQSREGDRMILRVERIERRFEVGERLAFSAHEVAEICAFYLTNAPLVMLKVVEAISANGVPFVSEEVKAQRAAALERLRTTEDK